MAVFLAPQVVTVGAYRCCHRIWLVLCSELVLLTRVRANFVEIVYKCRAGGHMLFSIEKECTTTLTCTK